MILSKTRLSFKRPLCPSITSKVKAIPPAQSIRSNLLAGITGVSLLLAQDALAQDALSSLNNSTSSAPSSSITITPINSAAKATIDRRDNAMEFQCKGGMFDCDGDRRDFAKQQYKEWLDAGGVPKRIRDGTPGGPRAF